MKLMCKFQLRQQHRVIHANFRNSSANLSMTKVEGHLMNFLSRLW